MSAVPVSPRRVFGVDFSGAQDAGNRIWICRAHPGGEGVRVESVDPLSALPGGAIARDEALRALVQKVIESPRSAWGFDFSFALPSAVTAALAPPGGGYGRLLEAVAACGDPDTLRARCTDASCGDEQRRKTDDEASTPFSPYNLRIYKQTFHGIADVLRPLRARAEVAVLPFDRLPDIAAADGARLPFNRSASGAVPHVYLMEVCPSSVLTALGYPAGGYKGAGGQPTEARRAIVARLMEDGLVRPLARALRERIVSDAEGDAVDAVLAAVGAWRGYRNHDQAALHADPHYGVEGFVYT
jgi:hypothetical protein